MKQILSYASVLLVLLFCGCGKGEDNSPSGFLADMTGSYRGYIQGLSSSGQTSEERDIFLYQNYGSKSVVIGNGYLMTIDARATATGFEIPTTATNVGGEVITESGTGTIEENGRRLTIRFLQKRTASGATSPYKTNQWNGVLYKRN